VIKKGTTHRQCDRKHTIYEMVDLLFKRSKLCILNHGLQSVTVKLRGFFVYFSYW